MESIDASFQKDIIKSELDSMASNQTWEMFDLPKGKNRDLIVQLTNTKSNW